MLSAHYAELARPPLALPALGHPTPKTSEIDALSGKNFYPTPYPVNVAFVWGFSKISASA